MKYCFFYIQEGSLHDKVSYNWKVYKIENSVFVLHIFATKLAKHKRC